MNMSNKMTQHMFTNKKNIYHYIHHNPYVYQHLLCNVRSKYDMYV